MARTFAVAIRSALLDIFSGFHLFLDGIKLGFAYLRLPATNAEERRLQDEDVAFLDELREELQEEGQH